MLIALIIAGVCFAVSGTIATVALILYAIERPRRPSSEPLSSRSRLGVRR